MSPTSATYWGISGYIIFWVLFAYPIDAVGKTGEPVRPGMAKIQEHDARGGHTKVQSEKRDTQGFGGDRACIVILGF